MSLDAFAPYPRFPYPLWVSLHPFRDGRVVGAITFGLSSFIGREIEYEGDGDHKMVLHKAAGLVVYLLEHGLVIGDGDTFGVNEAERVRVRYATSRRVAGLPVLLAEARVS
jgi:hypothetical protein